MVCGVLSGLLLWPGGGAPVSLGVRADVISIVVGSAVVGGG